MTNPSNSNYDNFEIKASVLILVLEIESLGCWIVGCILKPARRGGEIMWCKHRKLTPLDWHINLFERQKMEKKKTSKLHNRQHARGTIAKQPWNNPNEATTLLFNILPLPTKRLIPLYTKYISIQQHPYSTSDSHCFKPKQIHSKHKTLLLCNRIEVRLCIFRPPKQNKKTKCRKASTSKLNKKNTQTFTQSIPLLFSSKSQPTQPLFQNPNCSL